ncbi:MAG TPA: NADH:flavin oxidoreductase/NADH oxidase [Eubacteriaceae bacterium]|nr:NADH:flavin oxidoreductase/NADH oxidase [Eubacteriaceae bacterium]
MAKLFSPFILKDIQLKNRVVLPPICMFCGEDDGLVTDFHLMHYGTRAFGGVGLIIQEATGVERRGRITDRDLGIWDDSHIPGLKKLVKICKDYGAKIGIQLGHSGRKCRIHWEDLIAPSSIAFKDTKEPREMSKEEIVQVVNAFREGARRALEIGYDLIEIHGGHGYLVNQFLSPITNKRTDEYGGTIENRGRFLKEVVEAIRKEWPMEKPLCIRLSAEEYFEDGNHPEDIIKIINLIKDRGVDIINVSSGGLEAPREDEHQGHQIRYADIVKKGTGLPVIGGGYIISPHMAEEALQSERADLIFIGRELIRNPNWPLLADFALDNELDWPEQYKRAKPN